MATPSSLSYHDQSYPEGVHILRSQIRPARGTYCRSRRHGYYILSLKLVRNEVLHLVLGCNATRKQASQQQQLSPTLCSTVATQNHKHALSSLELARGGRYHLSIYCCCMAVYTKAPYFISPGSCTFTSSTSKTRVPPSTRRGGTYFSRPLRRQAVLERHGGLER